VVFTSRRIYGNRLTGATIEVKRLWMMAIDENPQPGVDPSHPAILMPGQDPADAQHARLLGPREGRPGRLIRR